jgi:UDP-glucose 4-epimerase
VLEKGTGEIFNIAAGVSTRDDEIFRLVRDALGVRSVEPEYVAKRPGEIDRIYLDVSKAERLLGWTPRVTLEEGARRTVEYFQQAARTQTAAPGNPRKVEVRS